MSHVHFTLLSSAVLAVLASAASAQAPRAEPVIVTASRIEQPLSETLAAVSVISREAIEASASVDVFDLLRRVPGLDIVRSAGLGQQTSVFLRGTNSNHTLVLIDGVRVSALGTGAYAWEQLPLNQVERIEIVRGPRAALWGADALGGVIQIFTRRQEGIRASLQAGNHDTYGLDAGWGQRSDNGGVGLHAGWLDTRGTNATRPGNWSFDPDRDGAVFRNLSLWSEAQWRGQRLEASLLHNDNDIQFDQGRSNTRQDVVAAALSGELGSNGSHRLNLGHQRDRLDTPDSFSRYGSRRNQADWQYHFRTGTQGLLTLGLSWLHERGHQTDTAQWQDVYSQSRHTRALFAGWQGRFDAQTLELSGRRDDNSVYGGKSSFAAAWGVDLSEAFRLAASWGQGFRAPTLNELYSPGWGGFYAGNPELAPERSRSLELGLHWNAGTAGDFALRLFRNDIDQMIDFAGPQSQAINIARARIDGAELEWHWQSQDWNLEANATWQDPYNRDSDDTLLRRAPRKASMLLERRVHSGLRIGLEGVAVARRPDVASQLPGYGLVSLRSRIPLNTHWHVDARVENLLDRDYTLVDGYHTPGLTALLSLRYE